VVLVEKSGELGGWAGKLYKRVPVYEPYKSPADTGVADLASQILADGNIKLYLNATIAKTDGSPGKFVVGIATESGATHTEAIGAIVQATGFTPYDMKSCLNSVAASRQTWSIRRVWKRWRLTLPAKTV